MIRHLPIVVLSGALLGACNKDDIVWVPFNASQDQTLVVEVSPACADSSTAELTLVSTLGLTPVGTAYVDPGCGPVGTNHRVDVILDEAYSAIVGRVTVDVATDAVDDLDGDGEPDDRGEGEYELTQDSANPGAWSIRLQSLGSEGEEREDRFTFHLWQPEVLATDPEAEATE